MSGNKKESHWIPLADLMTVLMVIFLFMSISYMAIVERREKEQNKIFKEYEASKLSLYSDLERAFKDDFQRWNLKLDKDLSIKFTNPQVLFDEGNADVSPVFKGILTDFLPKYLSIVLQEKYQSKIAEIRIEGHTNTKPINKTKDSYIDNMELSQNRARNVLAFLRQQDCFQKLTLDKKKLIQFWLTANGLSYGRTVDDNFQLSYNTNRPMDVDNSRRVEFRIVTTSEAIINEALKKINE
jgi:outer membrane protein OmpA-like peptidoglycan-associated protein